MPDLIYILVYFVTLFIDIILFAMMVRAVLSWFIGLDGSFIRFLFFITEPAIIPMRQLLVKMNWLQGSPFDFAFLLTSIALWVLQMILSSFI